MSQAFEFIKSCGVFFVLTLNGGFPAGRPFGAIMEHDGDLYISTGDMKDVYHQLKDCSNVQIVALKPGTRAWIRVTGIASECTDAAVKKRMLDVCPALKHRFSTPDALHFSVFRISVLDVQMN